MSIERPEKCIYIAPELTNNPAIPSEALRVYAVINRFCASGKGADVSASRLAEIMGRPRKVVSRYVRWLIDHKMIGRMMQPGKAGGRVTILWTEPPEGWEIEPIADSVDSTHNPESERVDSTHPTESTRPTRQGQNDAFAIKEARPLKLSQKSKGTRGASSVSLWGLSNDDILPEDWKQNQDFIEAWGDWIEQRRKKKFALTARARKIQAKNLLERSDGILTIAIEMLDRAANKGWGECFPLDDTPESGHGQKANPLLQ